MDRGSIITLIVVALVGLILYDKGYVRLGPKGTGKNDVSILNAEAAVAPAASPQTVVNVSYGAGQPASQTPTAPAFGETYANLATLPPQQQRASQSALNTSVSSLETCHGFWDCAGKTVVAAGVGFLTFLGL